MKQCRDCLRLLSSQVDACIYCTGHTFAEPDFKWGGLSTNYRIHSSEIVLDKQAYSIIEPIGKGGFGTVLRVRDIRENRVYAVKVPLVFDEIFSNNKGNHDRDIARSQKYLENEIDMFSKCMDATSLAMIAGGTVRAFFRGNELYFSALLMECAEATIDDIIQYAAHHSLPEAEKVKIVREIVNSICHLHSLDVVHRDLSPDNLFVVDRGCLLYYVLGDFGNSREKEYKNGGKSSQIVGHSAYMDPARFDKKYRCDNRSDIYSLGVIVTEVLMGNRWIDLFGEENISHVLAMNFETDFLLKTGAGIIDKPEIIEVIRKAVKRDPLERYTDVEQFRRALFESLEITSQKVTLCPQTSVTVENPIPQNKSIQFFFTILLPFEDTDRTNVMDVMTYQEGGSIRLNNYLGTKIEFFHFLPRRVTVKNTGFYSATVVDNAVLLNFRKKEFRKHLAEYLVKVGGDASGSRSAVAVEPVGELHFKALLRIEGETL